MWMIKKICLWFQEIFCSNFHIRGCFDNIVTGFSYKPWHIPLYTCCTPAPHNSWFSFANLNSLLCTCPYSTTFQKFCFVDSFVLQWTLFLFLCVDWIPRKAKMQIHWWLSALLNNSSNVSKLHSLSYQYPWWALEGQYNCTTNEIIGIPSMDQPCNFWGECVQPFVSIWTVIVICWAWNFKSKLRTTGVIHKEVQNNLLVGDSNSPEYKILIWDHVSQTS